MAKIEVSLPKIADPDDSVLKQVTEEAMAIAKGLPSPHRSSLREELRNRVQMNFPRVPVFVKDQFTAAALAAGMTKLNSFTIVYVRAVVLIFLLMIKWIYEKHRAATIAPPAASNERVVPIGPIGRFVRRTTLRGPPRFV